MLTVKRIGSDILRTGTIYMIPGAAVIAVVVWFFLQLLLNIPLGGFMNTWKWTYIIIMTLAILFYLWIMIFSLRTIWALSTKIDVPFKKIEYAWWEYHFMEKYGKEMKNWDKKTFEEKYWIAETRRGIAKAVGEALKGM
jgi:hypothetical protein